MAGPPAGWQAEACPTLQTTKGDRLSHFGRMHKAEPSSKIHSDRSPDRKGGVSRRAATPPLRSGLGLESRLAGGAHFHHSLRRPLGVMSNLCHRRVALATMSRSVSETNHPSAVAS